MEPSDPSKEPTMDTPDWRTQMPSDLREKNLNKIFEMLKTQLPFSGPEGIGEVRKFATEFEERIFRIAANQDDYLRQTALRSADGGIPTENENSVPSLPNEDPTIEWRTQLGDDSRLKNIEKTMDILVDRDPIAKKEGKTRELMQIAIRFEESSFRTAINQEDYRRKLCEKIEAYWKL